MFPVIAQTEIVEPIEYGDMDRWMVREVKESFIIGGNTKYLYELTTGDTLKNNTPYKNTDSPWGTSSVMARVSGVVKTSITGVPEQMCIRDRYNGDELISSASVRTYDITSYHKDLSPQQKYFLSG